MKNYALKAVEHFLNNNEPKRFNKYISTKNSLLYRTLITKEIKPPLNYYGNSEVEYNKNRNYAKKVLKHLKNKKFVLVDLNDLENLKLMAKTGENKLWRYKVQVLQENTIATKIKQSNKETVILGNSSILELVGRRVSFGHEVRNRTETDVQKLLSQKVPMLPFNVFKETGLNLNKINILEKGPKEKIVRKVKKYNSKTQENEWIDETVHFTGASLFSIQNKYFLFDIDRREVKHKVFNPFLVELPKKVTTIKEAYRSLKPEEVWEAESEFKDVKRQGEWFFIPVDYNGPADASRPEEVKWQGPIRRMILRAGQNRPNYATEGVESKMYVKGEITHSGREHADLLLKTWHKAVPNTATKSFTITGDVD